MNLGKFRKINRWQVAFIYFLKFLFIFIYLAVPGHSCNTWDLVPWSGIESGLPALGAQSLHHWTTRDAPGQLLFGTVSPREKAMAPHSSVLAWKIPGTGEPGGLPSMWLHRVRHDWSDLAAAAASVPASDLYPLKFGVLYRNSRTLVLYSLNIPHHTHTHLPPPPTHTYTNTHPRSLSLSKLAERNGKSLNINLSLNQKRKKWRWQHFMRKMMVYNITMRKSGYLLQVYFVLSFEFKCQGFGVQQSKDQIFCLTAAWAKQITSGNLRLLS